MQEIILKQKSAVATLSTFPDSDSSDSSSYCIKQYSFLNMITIFSLVSKEKGI